MSILQPYSDIQGWVVQSPIKLPGLARILISFLQLFSQVFSLYFLLSSFEHKYSQTTQNIVLDNIFIDEKLLPLLTFNPWLVFTGFRTTWPRSIT